MEKKIVENESANNNRAEILSMLLFGVSISMWVLALIEIGNNSLVCAEIQRMNGGMFEQCWYTVCTLWAVSMWYKLWIITAVSSTVACWCDGGFLSLIMTVASFFVPIIIPVTSVIAIEILTSISLSTWVFIIGCNIGVFFLWCIAVGVKEYLKEKKEVSLQM